ncbi:putative zinc-binding peptidase [Luteimonas vadosa]|uniref:Zinc-binding peptidase n=1 Tax=Luteimonas vadosa TaxID=1165507 RepID=A0ABP9E510_9GAMM
MKTFHCTRCNHQVFFENVSCERCGHVLGYHEDAGEVSAFEQDDDGAWRCIGEHASTRRYRQCRNYAVERVCNRMIPSDDPHHLCRSCQLTTIIPSLASGRNRSYWYKLERAKRRLLYTLDMLDLPVVSRREEPGTGLAFEFLEYFSGGPPVHTGHSDGLITINIAEADDAHRASTRVQMEERYRTLLGHFRHEIGHYYFMRLMEDSPMLPQCRELFGDDELDYGEALQRHYEQGPPDDWQASYVSAYATMHPYEDWAETWAHYLHMVDTLETAAACGMALTPEHPEEPAMPAEPLDIETQRFRDMIARWFPLTYAMNSLNRSMGTRDSYPFTLTPPVVRKLRFIHHVIRTQGQAQSPIVLSASPA